LVLILIKIKRRKSIAIKILTMWTTIDLEEEGARGQIWPHHQGMVTGYTLTFGQPQHVDLAKAVLYATFSLKGFDTKGYRILRPGVTWAARYLFTLAMGTPEGVVEKTCAMDGISGLLYQIFGLTQAEWNNLREPFLLDPPQTSKKEVFQVVYPLKAVCDTVSVPTQILLHGIRLQIQWAPLAEIFDFGAEEVAVEVGRPKLKIGYPLLPVPSAPPSKFTSWISTRQTQSHTFSVPAKAKTLTFLFPTKGILPHIVYYVFVHEKKNKARAPNTITMNPNPASVVTRQQTKLSDGTTVSKEYNASNTALNGGGLCQLYMEYRHCVGQRIDTASSNLSYQLWLDKYRIYTIELDFTKKRPADLNWAVEIELSEPTRAASKSHFMIIGVDPASLFSSSAPEEEPTGKPNDEGVGSSEPTGGAEAVENG
jgi:hypothetical protein